MGEQFERPNWWKATDGLWYPPEQHPDPAVREAALNQTNQANQAAQHVPSWVQQDQTPYGATPLQQPTWTQHQPSAPASGVIIEQSATWRAVVGALAAYALISAVFYVGYRELGLAGFELTPPDGASRREALLPFIVMFVPPIFSLMFLSYWATDRTTSDSEYLYVYTALVCAAVPPWIIIGYYDLNVDQLGDYALALCGLALAGFVYGWIIVKREAYGNWDIIVPAYTLNVLIVVAVIAAIFAVFIYDHDSVAGSDAAAADPRPGHMHGISPLVSDEFGDIIVRSEPDTYEKSLIDEEFERAMISLAFDYQRGDQSWCGITALRAARDTTPHDETLRQLVATVPVELEIQLMSLEALREHLPDSVGPIETYIQVLERSGYDIAFAVDFFRDDYDGFVTNDHFVRASENVDALLAQHC